MASGACLRPQTRGQFRRVQLWCVRPQTGGELVSTSPPVGGGRAWQWPGEHRQPEAMSRGAQGREGLLWPPLARGGSADSQQVPVGVVCRPLALCWRPRGPCHTRSVFTGPEWLDLGGVVFPAPRPGGASGSLPRAAPTLACPCPQNPPPFAPFWPGSPASTSTPRSPDILTHLRLQQRVPRASLRSPDPATWRLKPGGGGEKPEARWGPAPSPAGVPRGLKKLQLDSLGRGHHRTALIFKCMGSGLYKLAGVFTKSWGSSERRGRDRDRDRQTEGETHRD